MPLNNYIAIDLGATSGRVMVLNDNVTDEIYRFKDYLKNDGSSLTWDVDVIFKHILKGLKLAVQKYQNIVSLSVDSWGVDYVLLNQDKVIYPVYAYRDKRTNVGFKNVHALIKPEELYQLTGSQINQINTIYQLKVDLDTKRLDSATDFLFIPEYITYCLTGEKVHEMTMASTSGILDIKSHQYNQEIIKRLNLPPYLFKEVVEPGYVIKHLKPEVIKEIGVDIPVVMCCSHDTASAFYAVDTPSDAVIISSGTWSLIGVKLDEGNNSLDGMKSGFANELTKGQMGYIKNIMGLWIFNEVHKKHNESFDEVTRLAMSSTYDEIFDANDPSLLSPSDMEKAIINLLKNNPPKSISDIYRSIFRSLANAYLKAIEALETILKRKYNSIYIVGGGAKNKALNEFTEKITNRKVIALPIEATSLGNVKIQKGVKL